MSSEHVNNKITMKRGFGLIEIIIAVAVIALLGGGGLYFYKTKNKQPTTDNKSLVETGLDAKNQAEALKNTIEERNKEAVGEIDTSNLVPSEVEGWKTYRNEKYGFEVKYPNSYFYKETVQSSKDKDFYVIFSPPGKNVGINIFPRLSSTDVSEAMIFQKPVEDNENYFRNQTDYRNKYMGVVSIDGKVGFQVIHKEVGNNKVTLIKNADNTWFFIGAIPLPGVMENYDKILSTFKFIPS